jgi:hypothetical protein
MNSSLRTLRSLGEAIPGKLVNMIVRWIASFLAMTIINNLDFVQANCLNPFLFEGLEKPYDNLFPKILYSLFYFLT